MKSGKLGQPLSPESRKKLLGIVGEANSHLVDRFEYALQTASVSIQPSPATAPGAKKELGGYEEALRSVVSSYNALGFKAHRKLAEAAGRQPGEMPSFIGELNVELHRIDMAKQTLDAEPQRGRGEGTKHDHFLLLLAQIADAVGFLGNRTSFVWWIEHALPMATGKPHEKPGRDADKAIELFEKNGRQNPFLSPPPCAKFGLRVTEPFERYHRGDLITDPAEMEAAQKKHHGNTVRISLK